jgi:hypothetical protein
MNKQKAPPVTSWWQFVLGSAPPDGLDNLLSHLISSNSVNVRAVATAPCVANCGTEQLIVSTTYADGTGDEESDRRMRNAFIQLTGTDPGGDCRHSYL